MKEHDAYGNCDELATKVCRFPLGINSDTTAILAGISHIPSNGTRCGCDNDVATTSSMRSSNTELDMAWTLQTSKDDVGIVIDFKNSSNYNGYL